MKRLIWLDDARNPYDNIWQNWIARNVGNPLEMTIVWAKSFDEFEKLVYVQFPDIVCFDHDLDEEHYGVPNPQSMDYMLFEVPTGWHCAKWLIEYCELSNEPIPRIIIQSANSMGKWNIQKLFMDYGK